MVIAAADETRVPAGGALAVDRTAFAAKITKALREQDNIEIVCGEVSSVDPEEYTIVATGPLTTAPLEKEIRRLTGDELFFFDAASPIVSKESIDMEFAFSATGTARAAAITSTARWINATYENFVTELLAAEKAEQKDFENAAVFEGCMPVEVMAARGRDTLRFGTLKPVGCTIRAPISAATPACSSAARTKKAPCGT